MKKIIYTVTVALSLLTIRSQAQSETREVSDFSGISSSGPFNVHVKINGTESLKIEGQADVVDKIETVVENGNLNINSKNKGITGCITTTAK